MQEDDDKIGEQKQRREEKTCSANHRTTNDQHDTQLKGKGGKTGVRRLGMGASVK